MPPITPDHHEFRERFALAAIGTVNDPSASAPEMFGSYSALKSRLNDYGGGTGTLNRMKKPRLAGTDGLGQIEIQGDHWRFTARGAAEYSDKLDWARRFLGERPI